MSRLDSAGDLYFNDRARVIAAIDAAAGAYNLSDDLPALQDRVVEFASGVLGWRPAYADYRSGLRALNAITNPAPASAAPATASPDQR